MIKTRNPNGNFFLFVEDSVIITVEEKVLIGFLVIWELTGRHMGTWPLVKQEIFPISRIATFLWWRGLCVPNSYVVGGNVPLVGSLMQGWI